LNLKLAEILIHILQRMISSPASEMDLREICDDLVEEGYQRDEVEAATSWLMENFMQQGPVFQQEALLNSSRRVLHKAERHFLSPQARSFLVELQNASIINTSETEAVIEKAMRMEKAKLPFEDLQSYVSNYMLGQGRLDQSQLQRVVFPQSLSRN
jgi:Smg protein